MATEDDQRKAALPAIIGAANDDDQFWDNAAEIKPGDLDKADSFWRQHASPMFGGMISNEGFTFDPQRQQFIRSNGRPVKNDERRALLLALLASGSDSMEQSAGQMVRGESTLDQFQRNQANTLKRLHLAAAALGIGGLSALSEDDLKKVSGAKSGDGITGSLKKLRRFGKQIEEGGDTAESIAQITNRAGLYAEAAHGTHETMKRVAHDRAKDEDGNMIEWEERNVLQPADHCSSTDTTEGCLETTDAGWQPLGTLSLPGQRTCGPNCKCYMEYRQKPSDEKLGMSEDMKTEPIEGLVLSADMLGLNSEFIPALTIGQGLPAKRNGKPCHYKWKESMQPKKLHDTGGKLWDITPVMVDEVVEDVARALALGHEPFLPDAHKKEDRKKNFGYVKGIRKNSDGRIELLHQFVGDEEFNDAMNNKTSVLLLRGKKDENGNQYRWWLDHNACIPNPQDRTLGDYTDFQPALAASDGQAVNAVYLTLADGDIPMDLTPLRTALGEKAKDQPDEKILALSADEIVSIKKLSTDLIDAKGANKVLADKVKEVEAERDKALALADDAPEPESPKVVAMGHKLAMQSIDLSYKTGGLTKKQAEFLRTKAKETPALCLSDDAETPSRIDDLIAFAMLGANDPRPKGAPAQSLSLGDDPTLEPRPMTLERRNELRGHAGLPPLTKLA